MILEALLNEGRSEEDYANFSILFDLYMIAVVKPEKLHGIRLNEVNKEDDFMQIIGKSEELYVDSLTMSDSFGVAHSIDIDKIHQQIWKNKLNSDVEKFITTIQQRIIEEDTLPNRIPEHRSYTF